LKPDVPPSLTEVRLGETASALKAQTPYLVRMIKPNLIVSHDWHVQPICQRSLTVGSPERDRGSRFRNFIRMSSNLIALKTGHFLLLRRFYANLLNISNFAIQVKLFLCFST